MTFIIGSEWKYFILTRKINISSCFSFKRNLEWPLTSLCLLLSWLPSWSSSSLFSRWCKRKRQRSTRQTLSHISDSTMHILNTTSEFSFTLQWSLNKTRERPPGSRQWKPFWGWVALKSIVLSAFCTNMATVDALHSYNFGSVNHYPW